MSVLTQAQRFMPWTGPRTVAGPTDDVVVVGAGLAGLSAAMRLAGAGRAVTILEREDHPGGRAGQVQLQGPSGEYRIDTGPTVLTMPDLIADAFDCLGENMEDWLQLSPVAPLYRSFYPDGSVLDVHADVDEMAEESTPSSARRRQRATAVTWTSYPTSTNSEMKDFIDRNIDSPLDLIPRPRASVRDRWFSQVGSQSARVPVRSPHRTGLPFQAMYAGLSPYDALAIYAVIAYMDSVAGVFFPKGGMHAVPQAMAAAAEKHGVTIRYSTNVETIEVSGGRATAAITSDGERITADAFVLNPDLPIAYRDLLGREPWSVRRLDYSPSCYLLLAGSSAEYSKLAHHNILRQVMEGRLRGLDRLDQLMSDPSLLVTNPIARPRSDYDGKHIYYVLFPTPNRSPSIGR